MAKNIILRKLQSEPDSAYVQVGEVLETATTFTDTTAVVGESYNYKVRAAADSAAVAIEVVETGPGTESLVTFTSSTFSAETTKYHVIYPYNYATGSNYPVLIVLHGAGEFRNEATAATEAEKDALIWKNGPAKIFKTNPDMSLVGADGMIIISIQQPYPTQSESTLSSDGFHNGYITEIVNIAKGLKSNHDKIYLGGLSMGGKAVVGYASNYPQNVAAIVAISPNVSTGIAQVLADDVHTWLVHGDADSTVGGFGWGTTQDFYNSIVALSGATQIKFSKGSGVTHDSWTKVYDNTANTWTLVADGLDPIGGVNSVYDWLKAIEKVSIPTVLFNPTDGSVGMPVDQNIVITLSEAGYKPTGEILTDANVADIITFKQDNAAGVNIAFTATISADKLTITLNPTSNLAQDSFYYVAISVADVKGHTNNTSATIGTVSTVYTVEREYLLSFGNSSATTPAEYNDVFASAVGNITVLNTIAGVATITELEVMSSVLGSNNNMPSSGANTGLYPDEVTQSSWFTNGSMTLRLGKLPLGKYFEIIGFGNGNTTPNITRMVVDAVIIDQNCENNIGAAPLLHSFVNDQPIDDGSGVTGYLDIVVSKQSTDNRGYLNVLRVIQSNLPKP